MNQERFVGLQWKLLLIYLAVTVLSAGMVALGYLVSTRLGLPPAPALGAGLAAGLAAGLLGSAGGFLTVRAMKLRLWAAGDLAGQIARGNFSVRLPVGAPDEVGWLEEQLNQMAGHLEAAVTNLQALAEQNRRLAEEAQRGSALAERARLARDLHDTVNQQLFVLAMRTAAARRNLEKVGGEAGALLPELQALEDLARAAHVQIRELILHLRPTTLEQQGLAAALQEYMQAAGAREGWAVMAEIDPAIRLHGPAAEALFRVAQEAVNNISKHARAGTVYVSLARTGAGVVLQIRDDGAGFDPRAGIRPTAVGLIGMQERVGALGGTLRVESAPGGGTEVTVTLPGAAEGEQSR